MTTDTNGATPSANPSGSIAEAAEAFESILSGNDQETEEQDEEAPQPTEPSDDDQPEGEKPEAEDDEGEEGQESEDDESEDESADEEASEGEEEQEDVYAVKVDGQEIEIPASELIQGYQRNADYTRKTQALAEERKAFQSEATETRALRDQYAQGLQQLSEFFQQQQPKEPNWDELRVNDPIEFAAQWAEHQRHQMLRERVDNDARALMQQQRLERAQQARDWLSEQVPDWKDPEKFKADRAAIKAFGLKQGFSAEEMSQIDDPRAILLLRLAMQADRAREKAKAIKPVKKVAKAPVLKPGPASTQNARKTGDLKSAKQRLAKSGTLKDAADFFKTVL